MTSNIRDVTKAGVQAETTLVDLIGNAINENSQTAALTLEKIFDRLSKVTDHTNDLGNSFAERISKAIENLRSAHDAVHDGDKGWNSSSLTDSSESTSTKVDLGSTTDLDSALNTMPDLPTPSESTTPTAPSASTNPDNPGAGTDVPETQVHFGAEGNGNMPATGQSHGGNETFKGLVGNDLLKGGAGVDAFTFKSAAEAGTETIRDAITDLQKGQDKIDLSAIDANGSARGDGAFHLQALENAVFDHAKGALAWHSGDKTGAANDHTMSQGDMDGGGRHDFETHLTELLHLSASDFLL